MLVGWRESDIPLFMHSISSGSLLGSFFPEYGMHFHVASELPSVFRLPTDGFHATRFS